MRPVICIVGKSGSGKTTLVEKLIPELKSRGHRVATVKHTPKGADGDRPGKDSWRHLQAGSEAAVIAAPDKTTIMVPAGPRTTLSYIVRMLGEDHDIVVAEGFKGESALKIGVHRREAGPFPEGIDGLLAIATDEPLESPVRQLSLEDVVGLADLIEADIIGTQAERIALEVNGEPVPLKEFPSDIFSGVVTAMASCLRGVGEIRSLRLSIDRRRVERR
jgi:molybdopterin-guanine dinucleotide biosynthesis protein B